MVSPWLGLAASFGRWSAVYVDLCSAERVVGNPLLKGGVVHEAHTSDGKNILAVALRSNELGSLATSRHPALPEMAGTSMGAEE